MAATAEDLKLDERRRRRRILQDKSAFFSLTLKTKAFPAQLGIATEQCARETQTTRSRIVPLRACPLAFLLVNRSASLVLLERATQRRKSAAHSPFVFCCCMTPSLSFLPERSCELGCACPEPFGPPPLLLLHPPPSSSSSSSAAHAIVSRLQPLQEKETPLPGRTNAHAFPAGLTRAFCPSVRRHSWPSRSRDWRSPRVCPAALACARIGGAQSAGKRFPLAHGGALSVIIGERSWRGLRHAYMALPRKLPWKLLA